MLNKKCSRCEEVLTNENSKIDPRRNTFITPCYSCRNLQKRIKRVENKSKGIIYKSEFKNHYSIDVDLVGEEVRDFFVDNLKLKREIRDMMTPKILFGKNMMYYYCPKCKEMSFINGKIVPFELIRHIENLNNRHAICSVL